MTYKCHICENTFDNSNNFKYCPYCGNTILTPKQSLCESFHPTETIVGWKDPNTPILETRYECWGTKERDYCVCGGNESNCDFYEYKRNSRKNM